MINLRRVVTTAVLSGAAAASLTLPAGAASAAAHPADAVCGPGSVATSIGCMTSPWAQRPNVSIQAPAGATAQNPNVVIQAPAGAAIQRCTWLPFPFPVCV